MTRFEVAIEIPMKLPSLANLRIHWRTEAELKRTQRAAVGLALRTTGRAFLNEWKVMRGNERMRLRVTLTRISPGRLDKHDNLRMAFKAVVDEVAACCGLDDRSDRYEWVYAQEHGLYGVRVHLEVLHPERVPHDTGAMNG